MAREKNVSIIVAPRELIPALRRSAAALGDEVVAFESLAELDAWRRAEAQAERQLPGDPIGVDLEAALAEIGRTIESLPPQLGAMFEALADSFTTPTVRDVLDAWPSRRSFYRVWSGAIPLPPSAFLRRVRLLHAARLRARGITAKEAAHAAGFSSQDHMRRVRKSVTEGRGTE
jgi:AraC-like DNA-binding protein